MQSCISGWAQIACHSPNFFNQFTRPFFVDNSRLAECQNSWAIKGSAQIAHRGNLMKTAQLKSCRTA